MNSVSPGSGSFRSEAGFYAQMFFTLTETVNYSINGFLVLGRAPHRTIEGKEWKGSEAVRGRGGLLL